MSAAVTARRGVGPVGMGIVRAGLVGLAGAVLMWLSVAVTLAMTLPEVQPGLVLALWPSAALARNAAALRLMLGPQDAPGASPARREAQVLAGGALAREPVLAAAASTLGATATSAGDDARAVAAYGYAERLSRRDLASQMWLIERAVSRGDVAGALAHYDVALRANPPTVGNALLPIMARASAGAAVRGPLVALLRRKPSWRGHYLEAMLASSLPPAVVAEQLAGARLDPADPAEATILTNGLAQLVGARQYRLAAAILPEPHGGLHNAGFEQVPSLLPFDWWMAGENDLAAYRDPVSAGEGEGSYVLRIATKDRGGPVARQLLALPPGRFTLSGMGGIDRMEGSAVPMIAIACAERQAIPIATTPLVSNDARKGFTMTIDVPQSACTAQWIVIGTPASATTTAWVDGLRLRKTAGASGSRSR